MCGCLTIRKLTNRPPATLSLPLDDYLKAWHEVEAQLAWFPENPAAAHILALALLTPNQELWNVPVLKQPGNLHKFMLVDPITLTPERNGPQSFEEVVYG